MGASLGQNIARDGHIPVETIKASGVAWVRIVAMPDYDLTDYFKQVRAAGVKILLVLARESGGDYARYRKLYVDDHALIDAIQVGNEADIASPSSWTMSQQELVSLGRAVRALFPDMLIVCAGLASGHAEWLDGVDLSWADAIAFHGYLKDAPNPDDIEDLPDIPALAQSYARFGKRVWATEWGWWDDAEPRASEETRDMLQWVTTTSDIEVFFWFCASDSMVPPFGLTHADGTEKPRAAVFREYAVRAANRPTVDLRAYARAAAVRNGYPALHFERQIQQESGFDPNAYNAASGATGIAQIIPRFHPNVDPRDPLASLDYAAAWMAQLRKQYGSVRHALIAYNWGPGNLGMWIASGSQISMLPRETRHYLDVVLGEGWPEPQTTTPGRVTYDRNHPVHAQEETFDCSQESLEWALWAYGRQTSDDWLESTMLAEGVMSRELGLLDASGAGFAAFINRQYKELKFSASNEPVVSFDFLAAEFEGPSNPYPGLIGGRAWGHWSALRCVDRGKGLLILANPSDGFKGVSQTMNRKQFDALGQFSLVRVMHDDVLDPNVVIPPKPSTGVTRIDMDALLKEQDAHVASAVAQRERIKTLRDKTLA